MRRTNIPHRPISTQSEHGCDTHYEAAVAAVGGRIGDGADEVVAPDGVGGSEDAQWLGIEPIGIDLALNGIYPSAGSLHHKRSEGDLPWLLDCSGRRLCC